MAWKEGQIVCLFLRERKKNGRNGNEAQGMFTCFAGEIKVMNEIDDYFVYVYP